MDLAQMIKGRNPPNCIILDSWVCESFKLAVEPFAKALRILETCVILILIYQVVNWTVLHLKCYIGPF